MNLIVRESTRKVEQEKNVGFDRLLDLIPSTSWYMVLTISSGFYVAGIPAGAIQVAGNILQAEPGKNVLNKS